MIRKTVLLAGVTAALLTAAPALAQDAPAAPPAPAAQAQASGSIQLQPGSSVKGSDGSVLGTLEGVQSNAAGEQELTVRGSDGALRGVGLGGLTQSGTDVVVGITSAEFATSPVVEDSAPATTDGAAPAPSEPAATPPAPQPEPSWTQPTTDDSDDTSEPEASPTPQG
ncbi:superoxide dismutase [Brevundimonas staleyi]|uniref:Superoxide dismutase n=1 Tax=Brevundimonas staleyi TaxID=74326 RepID=A0ABW0FV46_9CAUL